jgi:DNA modification methylase
VLDPFVGSGTTCIVAYELQRNYLGIELKEEYYQIALANLNELKTMPIQTSLL